MNALLYRFSYLTLFCLVLTPPVVHASSVPADSTHFCAFDHHHQLQHEHPLPAAKRAADLNVGEPRTVRMIYFLPNDRTYRQEVVDSMKTTIKQVQTFYAEQMEAQGYGRKTFRFETDEQGEPLVHRVDGQHPEIRYISSYGGAMEDEIFQVYDEFRNVYFIILDSAEDARGSGGRRGKNGGIAWLDDVYIGQESTYWTFSTSMAHEIGHAFGLLHDFRDNTYIMSYGSSPDQLSACAAGFLAVHPYFNPDIPLEETSPPSISQLSSPEYPLGTENVPIELRFSDSDGLHQVLLFGNISNLVACRRSDGESDGVISFEYSGQYSVFGVRFIFTRLSQIPVHSLTVLAVDVEGNVTSEFVEVREEGTTSRGDRWPARIAIISGDSQRGAAGTLLPQPLVIEVRDQDDDPLPQEPVQFEVIEGGARLKAGLLIVDTRTDANGRAVLKLMLGPDPETNIVSVSTPQVPDCLPVYFSAVGTGAPTVSRIHGDTRAWHLPDGAIARLGRGRIGKGSKSVLFSSDGRRFAVASGIGVWLYDAETFRALTLIPTPSPVESIAFSPDGNLIAAGAQSEIGLLNIATGTQTLRLPARGRVTSVVFSPDGTLLAASTWFQNVELWDLATQTALMTFEVPLPVGSYLEPLSLAFSPDGALLAAGFQDHSIRLWDVETREHVRTLTGHRRAVRSVAFAPGGSTLASGSSDGAIRLWNTRTWESTVEIGTAHSGPVTSVAFAPDGMTLWSGSSGSRDRTSKLWDVPTGTLLNTYAANHTVTSVSLSPDGAILSSASSDYGRLVMWDTRTGGATTLDGIGHAALGRVAVSPDGKVIATGAVDGRVRLWDARTGQNTKLLFQTISYTLAFSPDGRVLATGTAWGIHLWNVATGAKIASFQRRPWNILSLAFSPDGVKLATGEVRTGEITVWDVASVSAASAALGPTENSPVGLVKGEIATAHFTSTPRMSGDLVSLAFSPDGTLLASGASDGTVTLWDARALTRIAALSSSDYVEGVSFSSDGGTLATIEGGKVELRKVPTLERTGVLSTPYDWVSAVSFSNSNTTLVSGYGDGTIRLWDAATQTLVAKLEGHTDRVHSVVFADGSTLVSASEDGTTLLWDMSPFVTPQTLAADFDGDGTVGFSDFLQFAAQFGLSQGDAGYDARFDLDGNGTVGFSDFLIFAGNFGHGT